MNTQIRDKLKSVLRAVPPGYLVTASWLKEQGIAYSSFRDYVKRGWLDRVARGVFRRPTASPTQPDVVDWETCVLSLQHIVGCNVHVGGATALRLQGLGHDLPLGAAPPVWLYGDRVPTWLARVPLDAPLVARNLSLFDEPSLGIAQPNGESSPPTISGMTRDWSVITSSTERAILEMIDEVPDHESLENVDRSFEALVGLRPGVLTQLLRSCKRVKTKRLFFVFADRHEHAWRKYVHPDDFDLGRGDRALFPGGSIHPRYRIVIPDRFLLAAKGGGSDA